MDPRHQPLICDFILKPDTRSKGLQSHQIFDALCQPACRVEKMTEKKEWLRCTKCSLTHKHALACTEQPSSMVMPLDMILACSKHASWSRGLLAFGLPSASNKLSQPDPSEVPSALEAESERKRERWNEMRASRNQGNRLKEKLHILNVYPFPSGPPRTHLEC